MKLDSLRAYLALAEELHFGRAARRLDVLPASLGRTIRLLETDLRRGRLR
jgi:DNA-binding transcriptional LysR family regulator